MPKASKKTKGELYSLIHEEIMKCRIEVKKEMERLNFDILELDLIDSMLYRLNVDCPQKTIDYFKD